MHAIVTDPQVPFALRLDEVAEPSPRPDQVVVEVHHVSVNAGEAKYAGLREAGTSVGYDAAGVVMTAAADGSGPAVGARVAAFGPGAWAERVAVGTTDLAEIPASVDSADAAALPMAGVTALRTLRAAGSVVGRRLLVTGAAGGVGRQAVQLAHLAGAYVVASVGSPARAAGLSDLGAEQVVVGLEGIDPVDVVLETVGGPHLVTSWGLLKPGGRLQSIGSASGEPSVFPPNSLFSLGEAKTISSFGDATNVGSDLAALLDLVACGRLSAEIGWRGDWSRIAEAAEELLGRRVAGKVVLDVTVP